MSLSMLDTHLKSLWSELLGRPEVATFLSSSALQDRRSYAVYLTQAYHYTSHTPVNQARVALRDGLHPNYRKFCLRHAEEEVGHELMALHDLRALGVQEDPSAFPMLPGTEQKIAYLYWLAEHANPVSRLGYSFWAEDSYGPGGPVLTAMKAGMGLTDAQTTFFTAHADIDDGHVRDVRKVLGIACRCDADWEAVRRAMEQSLRLTFAMLLQEVAVVGKLRDGQATAFDFLADLP